MNRILQPIFQRFLKTDISGMDRLSQRLFCSSLTILAAADYQEAIDYILGALRRADEQPAWLRDTLVSLHHPSPPLSPSPFPMFTFPCWGIAFDSFPFLLPDSIPWV